MSVVDEAQKEAQELVLLATFKSKLSAFDRSLNELKRFGDAPSDSTPASVLCKVCTNLEELQMYG